MAATLLFSSRGLGLLLLVASVVAAGGCGGGGDVVAPPDPPGPQAVASVEVGPVDLNLTVGQTAPLTAIPRAADGSALSGRTVTWVSSDPAIASVSESGVVSAASVGAVTITATSEGHSGAASIVVSALPVETVAVTPSPASVSVGQSGQLAVVLTAAGGTELPGRTVAWATSDAAIATVDGGGLATGVAVGHATITATSEGKTGSTELTVSNIPVALVEVDPPSASVDEGGTVQLTAIAKAGDNSVLVGRAPTWTTGNASVARVSATGKVTGVGAGTTTIVATIEGKTGTSTVTVSPQAAATVEITPASPAVVAGTTVQLTATVKSAGGTILTGRPVTWATSSAAVAIVSGTGLVTGVAEGGATITATSEGVMGTAAVTVTAVAGLVRTWKGGMAGKPTDWSAGGNWSPAGKPIPLDTVRVPATANAAILSEAVQIARLIVAGGRVRTAGYRLRISKPQ